MVKYLATVLVFLFSVSCYGASALEHVLLSLALPSEGEVSATSWEAANTLSQVVWEDSAPRLQGKYYVRVGYVDLPQRGLGQLVLLGDGTVISEVSVSLHEEDARVFEKNEFFDVLRIQFSNGAKIELLEQCDTDVVSASAYYRVTLPERRALHVMVETDAGGSGYNSRGSSLTFRHGRPKHWKCGASR